MVIGGSRTTTTANTARALDRALSSRCTRCLATAAPCGSPNGLRARSRAMDFRSFRPRLSCHHALIAARSIRRRGAWAARPCRFASCARAPIGLCVGLRCAWRSWTRAARAAPSRRRRAPTRATRRRSRRARTRSGARQPRSAAAGTAARLCVTTLVVFVLTEANLPRHGTCPDTADHPRRPRVVAFKGHRASSPRARARRASIHGGASGKSADAAGVPENVSSSPPPRSTPGATAGRPSSCVAPGAAYSSRSAPFPSAVISAARSTSSARSDARDGYILVVKRGNPYVPRHCKCTSSVRSDARDALVSRRRYASSGATPAANE